MSDNHCLIKQWQKKTMTDQVKKKILFAQSSWEFFFQPAAILNPPWMFLMPPN